MTLPRTRSVPLLAAIAASLAVSGCADRATDYPALAPTAELLAPPAIPGHAQIAADSPDQVVTDLTQAGQSLAVSSAELTAAPTSGDALTARADRLRNRTAEPARADDSLESRAARLRARLCDEAAADPAAPMPGHCTGQS
ncbi:MAG: hypothetical protein Q4G36_06005 [Paracoccus sp. (in: a-proteobacteria)]|nr:hypothetical protein [Paracoccus sp. (in: a-proteobacteria)]